VTIEPETVDLRTMRGTVRSSVKGITLDQMDQAVRRRGSGGYLYAPEYEEGTGRWGLGGSLGATVGQDSDEHTYVLGGVGFDQFPASDSIGINFHLLFGQSIGGLGIGGGLDATVASGEADLILSLQVGFADLL